MNNLKINQWNIFGQTENVFFFLYLLIFVKLSNFFQFCKNMKKNIFSHYKIYANKLMFEIYKRFWKTQMTTLKQKKKY